MSDENFLATTKRSIENLSVQSPGIADEVKRICASYENYFKRKYELERKERICEMETNMALRRENIDLRTELEALQVVIGQLKGDSINRNYTNSSRLDPKLAKPLDCEKVDSLVEVHNAKKPIKQDRDTLFEVVEDSVNNDTSGNDVTPESSRPRGTSIFGDLNEFFVDDNRKWANDANVCNEIQPQGDMPERGGRQPTSTLDRVLNSRKGSYFFGSKNSSPKTNKRDGDKKSKPLMRSSVDRVSPALKLDTHLSRSDFDASGMLGYGPTKTESDLAQRLAKLSGHSDLSPNELALALARSVNTSTASAESNMNAHSI